MSVYAAFYKGKPKAGAPWRDRLKYAFDGAIRVITRSPYSHCELAIPDASRPGVYFCVSASVRDEAVRPKRPRLPWNRGGVRGKYMQLPPDRWDLVPVPLTRFDLTRALEQYAGNGYDWLGVFRFLLPFLPESKHRWFCSEFVAHVLRLPPPHHHYTPQSLYQHIKETS